MKHLFKTLAISALAAGLLVGCRAGASANANGRLYPAETPRGTNLNIQIVRNTTSISLTNTTARDIPACTMWINMRYSRSIDALPIGTGATFDLRDFKDEYGESFRGGGFFASDQPQKLILAQLETPDTDGTMALLGLTVIAGGEE